MPYISIRSTLMGSSVKTHLRSRIKFLTLINSSDKPATKTVRWPVCEKIWKNLRDKNVQCCNDLNKVNAVFVSLPSTCCCKDQWEQGIVTGGGENQEYASILSALNSQDTAGRNKYFNYSANIHLLSLWLDPGVREGSDFVFMCERRWPEG